VVAIIEQIVEWVGPAFSVAGYYIVFAGVFTDRSAFLGLIIPGDVVLAVGGVYAARHVLDLPAVMAVGAVAGLAGESVGFWLGNRYGERLLKKIPILRRWAEDLTKTQEFFRRNGGRTVFIGRYVSVAGTFLPFVAGMSRMRYRRFLLFDVPSVTIWAIGVSLLGYFLESQIDAIDKILSRFGWGLLALIVLFFGGRFAYRRWIKKDGSAKKDSSSTSRSRS
jgi:membrane-associated protein